MPFSSYPQRLTFALFAALLFFAPLARGAVQPWAQAALMAGAALLMAALCLEKALTGAVIMPRTALDKPFLALAALFCLSLAFSQARADGLEAFALLAAYAVIFYAARHLSENRAGQRQVVYLLITMATVVALLALVKLFSPQLTPGWWQYADLPSDSMASGPYGNHNHLAGLLEMAIPLVFTLFLTRTRRGATLLLLIYLAILLTATHILTLSRGGWFSLAAALLVMLIVLLAQKRFVRKKLLLCVTGCLLLAFLFILGGTHIVERLLTLTDEDTVLDFAGRTIAWKGCLHMIAAHPFLGTGPGSFATLFPAWQPPGIIARFFNAHNDYLQYTAELGLAVAAIVLWIIIILIRMVIRLAAHPSRQVWGLSLGAGIGILTIILHSLVDFNLHIPANAVVLAALLGLLVGIDGQKQARGNNAAP